MKIVLSGVETNNKGAELMLYAILQEIERKYPTATVYLPYNGIRQGEGYNIVTSLNIKRNPYEKINKLLTRIRFYSILRRLHINTLDKFMHGNTAIKGCDYYIDGSGFVISDQQVGNKGLVDGLVDRVIAYHKSGSKIIYLPQAVGPFNLKRTKEIIDIHSTYVDLFFARENVSYTYLQDSGFNMGKVKLYPDFTSLVDGIVLERFRHLNGAVCIIPNSRMIEKGVIILDDYLQLINKIVSECRKSGRLVYLLVHAEAQDANLAKQIGKNIHPEIEVVSGLNALEVKGLISTSYLCVSSRFHGVASALNTCVPCLATSWSHKYSELYKDYNQADGVLPIDNIEACVEKIRTYLKPENHDMIVNELVRAVPEVKRKTSEMWEHVWSA